MSQTGDNSILAAVIYDTNNVQKLTFAAALPAKKQSSYTSGFLGSNIPLILVVHSQVSASDSVIVRV